MHRLCRNSFLDELNLTHMATAGLNHHSFAEAVRIKCDEVATGSSVEKHLQTEIVFEMDDRKSRNGQMPSRRKSESQLRRAGRDEEANVPHAARQQTKVTFHQ